MPVFKYVELAEQLRAEILIATVSPGEKFLTEDRLIERFGVSRNTARQAIALLVEQGLLVKKQGSGTFISEQIVLYRKKKQNSAKNKCIAIVMTQVNLYIFPSVLMGISDYLFEHDYYTIIRMTMNKIGKERQVLKELLQTDVAGIILEPARSGYPPVNHDLYQKIQEKHPCVLLHASLPGFAFPSVNNSNVAGFTLLVDHLVERGHRDIALICKSDEQSGVQRFQGYAEGLIKHNITVDESRILWFNDENFEDMFTEANAGAVMRAIGNCTAVMCSNDNVARKFLPFLQKRNIRIPDDLSVVGYDDLQTDSMEHPVTTIEHPKEELGRAAGRAILSLLENPFADVSLHFRPKLVDKHSVRGIEKRGDM